MAKINKPQFKIDKVGLMKVGKGLLIGVGGLLLTALESALPYIDFGKWAPVAVVVNSTLVNFFRKYIISY